MCFQDPWFRRLFSVLDYSINREEKIELEFIPFNSQTDQLVETAIEKRAYNYGFYDINQDYAKELAHTLDPIEVTKVPHNEVRVAVRDGKEVPYTLNTQQEILHLNKRNYLRHYPILYLLLGSTLLCGFILFNFSNYALFLHTLYVLILLIGGDFLLTQNKLNAIDQPVQNHFIRTTAGVDLNHTIYFRDYAAAQLKEITNHLDPKTIKRTIPHLYVSHLMLLNKPSMVLDVKKHWPYALYDTNGDGEYNLYIQKEAPPEAFYLAKQTNPETFYVTYNTRLTDRIQFLPHTHFNMPLFESVHYKSSYELEQRREQFEKLDQAGKRVMLEADPKLFTYLILKKPVTEITEFLKQKEKLPTDLFHGFIPITPEEQWDLLLK